MTVKDFAEKRKTPEVNYAIWGKIPLKRQKKDFWAPSVLSFRLFTSSCTLISRSRHKLSRKFEGEERESSVGKMTTNTKAITECSSCCWIIYCKYLFHFLFDFNVQGWLSVESQCEWLMRGVSTLLFFWTLKNSSLPPKSSWRHWQSTHFGLPGATVLHKIHESIWAVSVKARKKMFTIFSGDSSKVFVVDCERLFLSMAVKMRRKTLACDSARSSVFFLAAVNSICGWGCFSRDETNSASFFCSEKSRHDNHKELGVDDAAQQPSLRVVTPRRLERQNQRRSDDNQRLPVIQKRAGHRHASDSRFTPATSSTRAHRCHLQENLQGAHGSGARVLQGKEITRSLLLILLQGILSWLKAFKSCTKTKQLQLCSQLETPKFTQCLTPCQLN